MPECVAATSTSSEPGTGSGRCSRLITSGPPPPVNTIARIGAGYPRPARMVPVARSRCGRIGSRVHMLDREHIDGRIGEAWSGDVPNGSHINLVLAWRGSPTAAVAVSALANPRASQDATLVIVTADDGTAGYASGGDGLPDRKLLERLLRGVDPRDNSSVQRTCETVDFHGGRPWAVEVACWDLAGRAAGMPVWQLLGGGGGSLAAYASTGELAGPQERAGRAVALRDRGLRALKIRFHHPD